MDTYKQILLLGNGINRCFNANSWESLLLEIATNNKAKNGKIYFYEPIDNRKENQYNNEKLELLKILSSNNKYIELIDLGISIEKNSDYLAFYRKAIEDIDKKVKSVKC